MLSEAQLASLLSDVNNGFELSIDLLDQLDELMSFQTTGDERANTFSSSTSAPR